MNKDGRVRIELAALELFASEGIESASTRDIARRAGVAEGTLYRHFQTKEDLALSILLRLSEELRRQLEESVVRASGAAEQLKALIDTFFRFAAEEPLAYEYITHRHPRTLPPGVRLPKDVVIDVMRAGVASGAFGPIDPSLGAALVIGMVVRSLFFLKHGLLDMPAESVNEQVVRAALRVLKVES